jgi:hypothetical protein
MARRARSGRELDSLPAGGVRSYRIVITVTDP